MNRHAFPAFFTLPLPPLFLRSQSALANKRAIKGIECREARTKKISKQRRTSSNKSNRTLRADRFCFFIFYAFTRLVYTSLFWSLNLPRQYRTFNSVISVNLLITSIINYIKEEGIFEKSVRSMLGRFITRMWRFVVVTLTHNQNIRAIFLREP